VPSAIFWYVCGEYYLGTLVVRHQLTPGLAEAGGHVGYHVVAPWRRQGHGGRGEPGGDYPGYVGVAAAGQAGGGDVIGAAGPGWRWWVAGHVHPDGSWPAFWL
jgi:hypothetical protein